MRASASSLSFTASDVVAFAMIVLISPGITLNRKKLNAITKNIVIHAKMNRFKVLAANSSPSFNLFQSLFQFDVAVVVIEFVSEETVLPCFISFPSFGIDCLNDFREAEIRIRTVFI